MKLNRLFAALLVILAGCASPEPKKPTPPLPPLPAGAKVQMMRAQSKKAPAKGAQLLTVTPKVAVPRATLFATDYTGVSNALTIQLPTRTSS